MSAFSWFEEVAAACPRLGARSPASPEAIEEAAARVLVPPALRALYARSDGLGRPEVSRAAELGRLGPHDDPEAREELPAGLLVIGRLHDLDLIVLDVTVQDGPVGVWDPETPGTLRKKAPSLEVWLVRAVFDDVPRAVRATLVHRLREITSLADRATEEQLHHRPVDSARRTPAGLPRPPGRGRGRPSPGAPPRRSGARRRSPGPPRARGATVEERVRALTARRS